MAAGRYPELAGKAVLVTGAGREQGIGAAICRRLAAEGARVAVSDVPSTSATAAARPAASPSDDVERVVAGIKASGGEAIGLACDVQSEDDVSAAGDATVNAFGGLDILVNNAGIGFLMSPITETSADDWDKVLGVNLRGAFLATKHAAKRMIDQGRGGRIVNIASQAAKSGFPYAAGYCSSKHGMVGLTRVSAIELGQHGITVNAICPNHITTGLGAW